MSILKAKERASVLAMEKRLCPSDGFMFGVDSHDHHAEKKPLKLIEKYVRGTFAFKDADNASSGKDLKAPNPQLVDNCALGRKQDTLIMEFTLKVLGGLRNLSACNKTDVTARYQRFVDSCIANGDMVELGLRYAYSIAAARHLWRNRVGASNVSVTVTSGDDSWSFNSLDYPLNKIEADDLVEVESLGMAIAETLSGNSHRNFTVVTSAEIGYGQDVYPSQEMDMDNHDKNSKSKVLYHVDGIAAMHSQKIGNAIRTIDTWYPGEGEATPIPVGAFGSVTSQGAVYRTSKNKSDFFSLMYRALGDDEECATEERQFLLAMFILGGVFGESDKK